MFIYLAIIVLLAAFIASAYQHFVLEVSKRPDWIDKLHNAALLAFSYILIMLFNPAAFLTFAMLITVSFKLYDQIRPHNRPASLLTQTSRDLWLFLLIFWALRTFIYDYSPIPSGSMEPTLVAGDIIAINKTAYQIKVPPFKTPFYRFSTPKRGDVVVFTAPDNPNQFWIKRVIAIEGDDVMYQNKQFFVNGELYEQSNHEMTYRNNPQYNWLVEAEESIDDYVHAIQLDNRKFDKTLSMTVPKGTVFVSGDNRDYSLDSRMIGPIPLDNIVGKATHIITQLNWKTLLSFRRTGHIQ